MSKFETSKIATWDRVRALSLAAGSAARLAVAPHVRIKALDAASENFRLTQWYAPRQMAAGIDWTLVEPHTRVGRLPGDWEDAAMVGGRGDSWITMIGSPDAPSTEKYRRAVAYRLGTAIMVGDVPEASGVGITQFEVDGARAMGVATRVGGEASEVDETPHFAVGVRHLATSRFYQLPQQDTVATQPFPMNDLEPRYPGAILL